MKSTVTCLLLCAAAVLVSAEPPVSSYLPPNQQPSNQYGAPSGFGNTGPSSNNYQQKPSSQYGAPSNSYIPPSNNYAAPQPQSQYGAPSNTAAVYKPQPQYGAPSAGAGGYGNGQNDYESNEPARYNFEYNVQDYQSGNDFGHMETRDGDRTTGRYYVLLPDGRKQIVTYEADQNGYRPTITYEQTNQGNNNQGGGYNANAQPGKFNGY